MASWPQPVMVYFYNVTHAAASASFEAPNEDVNLGHVLIRLSVVMYSNIYQKYANSQRRCGDISPVAGVKV